MTSSSSVEHCNSAQTFSSLRPFITEFTPIRFQKTTVHPNADKTIFTFSGGASADEPCYIKESENDPLITNIYLTLAYVNENGKPQGTPIQITYTEPTFPTSAIDFDMMNVRINDPEKKQCGNFILYITVIASDDTTNLNKYVSRDSIEFVREPIYCEAEPKSSSSAAIDSVVRKVEIRQFNGLMSTSETRGYSFKIDAEVPKEQAQIQISMDELTGILTLHGLDGYKVVIYDNDKDKKYNDDWTSRDLPPSPTFTTDFKFTETKLIESTRIHGFLFAIVIGPNYNKETGDDFYAITIKNNDYLSKTVEIIYYKK